VAKDHPDSVESFPQGEDLLIAAIKGNQKKLMMYDYKEIIEKSKAWADKDLETTNEILAFKQVEFTDERKVK
jgi:hypothetical protein